MKQDKLKVLQIVGAPAGGIRKHIVDIIMGLPSERYEIGLAASLKDADEMFNMQVTQLQLRCEKRIYDIQVSKKPSLGDLKNLYLLWEMIKKENYDVVHGHGAKGGVYARVLGSLLGAKVIYTPHGGSLHSMHGKIKNKIYAFIERILYILTDKLIFESKYSRQAYFDNVYRADKKSVVNYNGVDVTQPYFPPRRLSKERITKICAFGILRYLKGHDILIRAAKELIDDGYQLEVNIFGSGEEQANLQRSIEKLELQNHVFLRGETDQVAKHMKESDILVHPSRFESFGYVVAEAMSMGLPVVASGVGGISELLKDHVNGLVVADQEPSHYANAIRSLINTENQATMFALQAHSDVQKQFSLRQMIENLSKIYQESNKK